MSQSLIVEEHLPLLRSSSLLIEHLRTFRERIVSGDVAYEQHYAFSERANSLALYLEATLQLVKADLYTPAFAVLRSALEHHLLDVLMYLGRRYVRVVPKVDDETWEQWQSDREAGADWTSDIVKWHRENRRVTIVRSGIHAEGGKRGPRARALSLYYFLLEDYDPFAGHPRNQTYLSSGFVEPDVYLNLAQRNQELYRVALKWSAVKDNLRINRLYGLRDLAHLEVHYSFLSAFVHPTIAGYGLVYGSSVPSGAPRYDHYSSELCLLYLVSLASGELLALERMTRRVPRVKLRDWEDVGSDISHARDLSAHLWFPPDGSPHDFDRIEEANRRSARNWGKKGFEVIDPGSLSDRVIRYYRNPLRRLVRMHHSSVEFATGLEYRSPWHRSDGRL
jgi:hypothetical protein